MARIAELEAFGGLLHFSGETQKAADYFAHTQVHEELSRVCGTVSWCTYTQQSPTFPDWLTLAVKLGQRQLRTRKVL
ncbi:MAG: hypothetical protein ACFFB3_12880 [Candidatus Hodarchaeota archaeon]